METVSLSKRDEIVMKLVHYFVTEKNYTPIVVNGVKDEIWLENNEEPYKIVRINSNYIHNEEQYNFDLFKIKNIMKQIKKKTMVFKMNTLSIFTNLNDDVKLEADKDIMPLKVNSLSEIKKSKELSEAFPDLSSKLLDDLDGVDLIVNVTKDINKKTEVDNKMYAETFMPKKIIITKLLIAISVILFLVTAIISKNIVEIDTVTLVRFGANYGELIRNGEVWRLITSMFLHGGIIHLVCNMYALYIIGSQMESYIGKWKFLSVYLISGIAGNLLSIATNNAVSIGASGAIFGILGSLLYFGYHYRLYLGSVIKTQIVPLIIFNLILGFVLPGIDNAAHIGGLVAGLFATIALGIKGKSKKSERINGAILLTIFMGFLVIIGFKLI